MDSLDRQIAQLEAQLKLLKSARAAMKKMEDIPRGEPSPATRFYMVRPITAAQEVLRDRGKPIPEEELRQILMDGGIAIGKKRGVHNVNVGLRISIDIGELTCTGRDKLIGLPEWSKKK